LVLITPYTPSLGLVLLATLLLGTLLVDEAVNSTAPWWAPAVSVAAAVGLAVTAYLLLRQDVSVADLALLGLVAYLIGTVTVAFRRLAVERREGTDRYGALLSEYRDLKRVSAASADAARAEERISVARRLHDSVGQRLTSLLMQLEVSRLGAETDVQRQRAVDLKRLAQASLDETREAVTALTEDELAGMPALLRLVHNLEVESAMQVEFTIGSGALSVQLDREPAVALYRAVQEALTNAMRHGASRRAKVTVEVPAGRLLRFEVWNEVPRAKRAPESARAAMVGPNVGASSRVGGDAGSEAGPVQATFRPGFGLTSMRERVEAAGGQLEVVGGSGHFLVRGSFPLEA
jgi:signal transduction histidine kinase